MSNISAIIDTLKDLIDVKIEMIKRELKVRITSIVTRLVIVVLMVLLGLFMLMFLSFSLAFYLSEISQSPFMGFLYVAGIYLILLVILYFVRNSLQHKANLRTSFIQFVLSGKVKKDHE